LIPSANDYIHKSIEQLKQEITNIREQTIAIASKETASSSETLIVGQLTDLKVTLEGILDAISNTKKEVCDGRDEFAQSSDNVVKTLSQLIEDLKSSVEKMKESSEMSATGLRTVSNFSRILPDGMPNYPFTVYGRA
jgi:gas vesicle protein